MLCTMYTVYEIWYNQYGGDENDADGKKESV